MKSLLPQAFAVSNVNPRPRKRLARYTLDCGFKTSESPALRGFVAERAPIRGTSLYLVLKSNGLHRPKIRLKKFGFSPKIVPANISKKLPAQVLSQIVFHPVFQPLAQMAHVRFHRQKRVHARLRSKNRTQRLTRRNKGDYRSVIPSAVYRHFSYRIGTVSAENVERRTEAKNEPKDNSLTHNGCAPTARVRCAQAPRAHRHAQPRCYTSLRPDRSRGSFRSQQQNAEKHICCFYTPDCSMRLATRCRSVALSTAFICR